MTVPSSDLDLFADDVLLDPYPHFAELRELGGVVHLPADDVYALTRYDVIRDALGDPETFSSRTIAFNPMANEALQGTSLASGENRVVERFFHRARNLVEAHPRPISLRASLRTRTAMPAEAVSHATRNAAETATRVVALVLQ